MQHECSSSYARIACNFSRFLPSRARFLAFSQRAFCFLAASSLRKLLGLLVSGLLWFLLGFRVKSSKASAPQPILGWTRSQARLFFMSNPALTGDAQAIDLLSLRRFLRGVTTSTADMLLARPDLWSSDPLPRAEPLVSASTTVPRKGLSRLGRAGAFDLLQRTCHVHAL